MTIRQVCRWLADPPLWVVIIAGALVAAGVQSLASDLVGVDGYFHARYSERLLGGGLAGAAPALRYGLWATGFVDKELGFHLLLAPWTLLGPIVGAKLFVIFVNTALIAATFLVARRLGLVYPALWALALPFLSVHLLYRLQMPRAHLLSVALFVPFVWALLRRRRWWIVALSAVFALSYTAAHFYLAVAIVVCAARSIHLRRVSWRPLAWTLAGVALGMLLHPQFPANLQTWYVQNVEVLSAAWGKLGGVRLGPEILPATTREWLHGEPFFLLLGWAALLLALVRRVEIDEDAFVLLALGSALGGLTALSMRFVEYFIPVGTLLWAKLLTLALDRQQDEPEGDAGGGPRARLAWRLALVGLLVGAIAYGAVRGRSLIDRTSVHAPAFLQRFGKLVGAGETVFTCAWDTVPELYYTRPEARFVHLLDPLFLLTADPQRYAAWLALTRGWLPSPERVIAERFDARWVVCEAGAKLTAQLHRAEGVAVAFGDGRHVLFRVPAGRGGGRASWRVAGPMPLAQLAQTAEQSLAPAPRPRLLGATALPSAFLLWPPAVERPGCFAAETALSGDGKRSVLTVSIGGRVVAATLGGAPLAPPASELTFGRTSHRWNLARPPTGRVQLRIVTCIDPAVTSPPYAVGARLASR